MADDPKAPVVPPVDPSGDDDKKSVAYETHVKLLGEKKRLAERLAAQESDLEKFRAAEKERETKELEAAKNYDQIQKNLKEELAKKDEQLKLVHTERVQARKLDAFIKTLGASLEQKYWGLVDIDQIAIDPATGQIDDMSVSKYVDAYRKTYPETIRTQAPGMPSKAPEGSPQGKLTVEQWKGIKDRNERWAAVREGRVSLPK